MVLTLVEQKVRVHLKVLYEYRRFHCSVTLTQLARWSVDTALKLNLLADPIEPDDVLDRTEEAMRKSLTFLEDPRRYYDERKDPTLTLEGINQLLLNDNHPLSAQIKKIVIHEEAEAVKRANPTVADTVVKRAKRGAASQSEGERELRALGWCKLGDPDSE